MLLILSRHGHVTNLIPQVVCKSCNINTMESEVHFLLIESEVHFLQACSASAACFMKMLLKIAIVIEPNSMLNILYCYFVSDKTLFYLLIIYTYIYISLSLVMQHTPILATCCQIYIIYIYL